MKIVVNKFERNIEFSGKKSEKYPNISKIVCKKKLENIRKEKDYIQGQLVMLKFCVMLNYMPDILNVGWEDL